MNRSAVKDRFPFEILDQMGLNPNKLSYSCNGLDQKLVGVEGMDIIKQVV